jgi:hypothetical protein
MFRNIIFLLMYHRHKLLDLIYSVMFETVWCNNKTNVLCHFICVKSHTQVDEELPEHWTKCI